MQSRLQSRGWQAMATQPLQLCAPLKVVFW